MNRVEVVEATVQETLDRGTKPDGSPLGDLVALEREMAISVVEHFAYQSAQSRAFAAGAITQAEAMSIYTALGEAPGSDGWAAGTSLARKIAVTTIMPVLLR